MAVRHHQLSVRGSLAFFLNFASFYFQITSTKSDSKNESQSNDSMWVNHVKEKIINENLIIEIKR